jgi:hypothetical protein
LTPSPPVDRYPDQRLHRECVSTVSSPADRSLDQRSHGERSGSSAPPQGRRREAPLHPRQPPFSGCARRIRRPRHRRDQQEREVRGVATQRPLVRCAGLDAPAPLSSAPPPIRRPNPARPSHLLPIPHTHTCSTFPTQGSSTSLQPLPPKSP